MSPFRGATRGVQAVLALWLGALLFCLTASPADAAVSDFDFSAATASVSTPQAGDHPDLFTGFRFNGDPAHPDGLERPYPWGRVRDVSTELPAGLTGNPQAFPVCRADVFANVLQAVVDPSTEQCPTDSQVGIARVGLWNFNFAPPDGFLAEPLYNLESPGGDVVARLGFYGYLYPIFIDIRLDPERDNALTATVVNAPSQEPVTGTDIAVWGVPGAVSHNEERFNPLEAVLCSGPCNGPVPSGLGQVAFMTNPTSCGPAQVRFAASNYEGFSANPRSVALPDISGCDHVPFEPAMSLAPTSRGADSASGMDVDLTVPQPGLEAPNLLASAHLKRAVVTLPRGVTLNPSAADGLGGCSEAQVGLVSTGPPRFNAADPSCPESSKVGTAKITTPVLADPLEGSLYVARQGENPFGSFLAGYLVAKGKGVMVKVAGRFDLDPDTGQITAVFDDNPQQPFSDLQLHFKGGARGVLITPSTCGAYRTHYELTPWSGTAPVSGDSPFSIDQGCDAGGFSPGLNAGAANPVAGSHSPFIASVSREDGEQNVAGIEISPPRGELAKLAGVPVCPPAQAASGACPAASRIGSASVAVGAGTLPLWIPQPGRSPTAVYLGGPYKAAPYSLIVDVPAQAGPFDLGNVVTRAGIHVDPETTRVTVKSDPLPQILEGVPVGYRRVHVELDRPGFALNPTSCRTMTVDSQITSSLGATARPGSRFQLGGCGDLGFGPKLSLVLTGRTNRGAHPALRALLTMPGHGANIARARVALPHSEFLDQAHIKTICTRVQFGAEECPAGSVYGHARAITPLLDEPLEGNVYLRSSSHELPDLVADLRGRIHVVLDGRIDSINGGIRTTFASVPDAPVSRFVLMMKGGGKGLLVNSTNVCRRTHRARAQFTGQNGKTDDFAPVLRSGCGGGQRPRSAASVTGSGSASRRGGRTRPSG